MTIQKTQCEKLNIRCAVCPLKTSFITRICEYAFRCNIKRNYRKIKRTPLIIDKIMDDSKPRCFGTCIMNDICQICPFNTECAEKTSSLGEKVII